MVGGMILRPTFYYFDEISPTCVNLVVMLDYFPSDRSSERALGKISSSSAIPSRYLGVAKQKHHIDTLLLLLFHQDRNRSIMPNHPVESPLELCPRVGLDLLLQNQSHHNTCRNTYPSLYEIHQFPTHIQEIMITITPKLIGSRYMHRLVCILNTAIHH
jgi:hypothetical protein